MINSYRIHKIVLYKLSRMKFWRWGNLNFYIYLLRLDITGCFIMNSVCKCSSYFLQSRWTHFSTNSGCFGDSFICQQKAPFQLSHISLFPEVQPDPYRFGYRILWSLSQLTWCLQTGLRLDEETYRLREKLIAPQQYLYGFWSNQRRCKNLLLYLTSC